MDVIQALGVALDLTGITVLAVWLFLRHRSLQRKVDEPVYEQLHVSAAGSVTTTGTLVTNHIPSLAQRVETLERALEATGRRITDVSNRIGNVQSELGGRIDQARAESKAQVRDLLREIAREELQSVGTGWLSAWLIGVGTAMQFIAVVDKTFTA